MLVSSIGHIFAHIRINYTAMEGGVRCQPLVACGWPTRLRARVPSLLDNSIIAFFLRRMHIASKHHENNTSVIYCQCS